MRQFKFSEKGHYVFVVAGLLLILSCNSRVDKGLDSEVKLNKFEVITEKIFKPRCLNCHSGTNASAQVDLSRYESVMDSAIILPFKPEESKLYQSLPSGRMPKGSAALSTEDLELVFNWIKEGAKQIDTQQGPSTPPDKDEDDAAPTFTKVATILNTRCVVCHNAEKPRGKVDLTSYEALMKSTGSEKKPVVPGKPELSGLFLEVEEQHMPPVPKMLVAAEIQALREWIVNGALEKTPGTPPLPSPNQLNPPRPTYEWLSKNIFSRRCGSCHGIPFRVGKIDFTHYQSLVGSLGKGGRALVPGEPDNSGIYKEVLSGSMPPARKVLNPGEVRLIAEWILGGALNN